MKRRSPSEDPFEQRCVLCDFVNSREHVMEHLSIEHHLTPRTIRAVMPKLPQAPV